jgi:hypothetical protein
MMTLQPPATAPVMSETDPYRKLAQLKAQVERGEVIGAVLSEPIHRMTRLRFFVSSKGDLCFYGKGRKRWGTALWPEVLDRIVSYVKPPTEAEKTRETYKIIAKYRRMAQRATFSNPFVASCRALPASFEQWKAEGGKSLYQYNVTTGTRIDGRVISVKSLEKTFRAAELEAFRQAIQTKTIYNSSRLPFRGYEAALSTWSDGKGGIYAGLSLEFKGCGNGYYYLLINDDNFIGADVD